MKLALSLAPLLFAATIAAQRVVVVDANNGPGTTHTTLAAAFANLLANDYIVVRAGTYTGLTVTTPLDFVMVGEGGPLVIPNGTASSAFAVVMNGSSYQRIAIRGIDFEAQLTGQRALTLWTNYNFWPSPTAELEDVSATSIAPQVDRIGLVAQSIGLTASNCFLQTTQVASSLASFVDCELFGSDAGTYQGVNQHAQTALDVSRSEIWIIDSLVRAGSSNFMGSPPSTIGFMETSSVASKVHVAGSSVIAADPQPNLQFPMPFAFINYQTWWPQIPSVDYEPTVVFQLPAVTAFAFGPSITATSTTVPTLKATDAPLGGTWTCTAHGATNDIALLAVATATHGARLLGMPFLAHTGLAVVTDFAILGGTGTDEHTFAPISIPNDPLLLGIVLQASSLFLAPSGAIAVSNPATGVLH